MEETKTGPAVAPAPAVKEDERRGATSASNAAADRGCEGRFQAQKGLTEPPSSEDAKFGTQIHDALFKQDPTGLTTEQHSIYDSMNEITQKLMIQVFGPSGSTEASVFRERRFWVGVLAQHGIKDPKPVRYEHSGKCDFVARLGTRGLIIEYKTLPGDIDDESTNDQLRDQVVLSAGTLVLKEVHAALAQPLVTHKPVPVVYNEDAIKRAEQEMYARVRNSNKPNPKRTANKQSCKFCLARYTCTEYLAWAPAQVPSTGSVAGVPVKDWTPEQRAHFCNMRQVAQQWLDESWAEMKRLVKADAGAVPGWAMRPGNIITKFNDPHALFHRFRKLALDWAKKEVPEDRSEAVIQEMFMECVDIRKKDLEGVVRKITGLKGKELATMMDMLELEIVDAKQNEPSLSKVKVTP
jgi:hypothetical protein